MEAAATLTSKNHAQPQQRTMSFNSNCDNILEYPLDFFGQDGAYPKDEEEASKMWSYRKERPKKGEMETVEVNSAAMLIEVRAMKEDIRLHVEHALFSGIREEAKVQCKELWCQAHTLQ